MTMRRLLLFISIIWNLHVTFGENWLKGENGMYYHVNEKLLSWADAIHECEEKSARLINIIDDMAKASGEEIIQGREREKYWIGLSEDLFKRWVWSKGTTLGFSNWEKKEPRSMSDQLQCAAMNSEGRWESEDCDVKRKSICQRHFADDEEKPTKKPESKHPMQTQTKNKSEVAMATQSNKTKTADKPTSINKTKSENSARKSRISNSSDSENESDHFIQTEYEKMAPPTDTKKYMKQEIALMNKVLEDFRKGSDYKDEPTKKNTIKREETTSFMSDHPDEDTYERSLKSTESAVSTLTAGTEKQESSTTKNLIPVIFRPRLSDTGLLFARRQRNPTVKTIIVPYINKKSQTSLQEALKTLDPLQTTHPQSPLQRDVTSLRSVRVEGTHELCVFPFVYQSISYFDCIPSETRKDKTWCATTNNFDRDLKWGDCDERSAILNKSVANNNDLNNNQNATLSNLTTSEDHKLNNAVTGDVPNLSVSNKTTNRNLTVLHGNEVTPDKIHHNPIILKDNSQKQSKTNINETAKPSLDFENKLDSSSDSDSDSSCPACVNNATSADCQNCKECETCKLLNGEANCESCNTEDKPDDSLKSDNSADNGAHAHNNSTLKGTTELYDPGKNTASEEQGNKDIDELLGQVLEQQGLSKQEQNQIIGDDEKNAKNKPTTPNENGKPTSGNSSSVPMQSLEEAEKNILNVDNRLMEDQQKLQNSLNNTKNITEHLRDKDDEPKPTEKPAAEDSLITTHDQKTDKDDKLVTAAEIDTEHQTNDTNVQASASQNQNETHVQSIAATNATAQNSTTLRQNITDQNDEFDHIQPEGIKLLYKNPDPLKNGDLNENTDKWHFLNVDNFDGLSNYLNTTRHMKPHIVAGLVIPIMTDIPLSHNNTDEPILKRKSTSNKSEQQETDNEKHVKDSGDKRGQAINRGDVILTYGGNSNNEPCQFPFIYDGDSHFECINNEKRKPWCGTTDNYDKTPLWGFCCFDEDCVRKSKTIKHKRKQKPKTETAHYHSPASIQYPQPKHLKKIISISAPKRSPRKKIGLKTTLTKEIKEINKTSKSKNVGHNPNTNKTIHKNMTSLSPQNYQQYNSFQNNYAPNFTPQQPPMQYTGASIYPYTDMDTNAFIHNGVKTYGGNSNGANCIIPFIYGGRVHKTCIPVDDTTSWCATTNNFDTDMRWGNCCDSKRCTFVW